MAFKDRKKARPRKQEEEVARDIGGKRVKASGALRHAPGDATNYSYLVDAKTTNRSFTLNAATLRKVTLEGASKGKIGILQVELEDLPLHMRKWAVVPWEEWLAAREKIDADHDSQFSLGVSLSLKNRGTNDR